MHKHAVLTFASLTLALAGAGCTSRMPSDVPDAFTPPIDASVTADTAIDAADTAIDAARADAPAMTDTGGSACGATNLGSATGDAVAMGSTASMTDRHTPDAACADGSGGPDAWFSWTAPMGGTYAFDTNGSSFDTVLDVRMGCTGGSLGCDDDGSASGDSLVQTVVGNGQTVIVIVDGYSSSGDFVLNIHHVVPEVCDNHLDDDGDGDTDCDDYDDCDTNPACSETGAECSDGMDNDGDGDTDCIDFDCYGEPACTETVCDDGNDDDGDGDTDCHDYDCDTFPTCDESMHCDDGMDNDFDLDVDCDDFDCSGATNCDESLKCSDHVDNDADDYVDCADTDCAADPACTTHETDCNDGLDDDGDTYIDCTDADCDAHCMESTLALCMNTTDDDGDSLTDCADRQCSCSSACPPAVAPNTACPDSDIGSAMGNAVFTGTITPYACGARADASCGGGGLGGEIELAWTAPADGYYRFDTNDTSASGGTFDTIVAIRTACDASGTELACSDDGGTGLLSAAYTDLMAGESVIIVIDANAVWDGGAFALNIHAL